MSRYGVPLYKPWSGPVQWKVQLKNGTVKFCAFTRSDPIYDYKLFGESFDRICKRAGVHPDKVSCITYG